MKLNYRKPAVAVAVVGGVLALSGTAAFAYWTAQGTGTGTAKTADASQPLTITQAAVTGSLTPGGTALPISGSVANPNGFNVPFTLSAVPTIDSAHSGCQASWYTVTLTTSPTSAAANGSAAFAGTIAMANASENQDACKGATVTVTYTAASA